MNRHQNFRFMAIIGCVLACMMIATPASAQLRGHAVKQTSHASPPPGASGIVFDPSVVTVTGLPVPPWLQDPAGPSTPAGSPGQGTGPQVVTTTTATTSSAATTTVPKTAPQAPPLCLNYPQYTSLPGDMYRDKASGNCFEKRGPDAIGTCDKKGAFHLVLKDQVAGILNQGYKMAIMVDGVGMVCLITDVATFHADPTKFVDSGTYVEGGDTHFPLYACQTPFGDETVPFYKYYVRKGTTVTPTQKEEPGCKTAAPKARVKVRLRKVKYNKK